MLSAERGYRLRIQVRPGGKLLLGPFGMAIWKIFWMFRVQADRVLQDRRRNAMRRRLDRLQAEAAADTAAQDMEFFEIEMVHQRDMVSGVGVPAMVCLDVGAGVTGIALVHRHGREAGFREVR